MAASPEDWYRSLPKITRGYMTAALATTVLVQLEFISPKLLYLDFPSITSNLEVWRLLTNFVFLGPFSMNFCFSMFFLIRYGRELEAKRFEGRAADMLWMMGITGLILCTVAYALGEIPFMSQACSRCSSTSGAGSTERCSPSSGSSTCRPSTFRGFWSPFVC